MIYTKNGDGGVSSTIDILNEKKDSCVFRLLGDIDELGAFLGFAKQEQTQEMSEKLESVQNQLILASAYIAGGNYFDFERYTSDMEVIIDMLEAILPKQNKIEPCGRTKRSSVIDICRTVARRCERCAVTYNGKSGFDSGLIKYLNRLSDYLFILGRYCDYVQKEL